ncbi:MAG: hypothetical protein ACUVTX_07415, partial [Bacteroidales bacterium]
ILSRKAAVKIIIFKIYSLYAIYENPLYEPVNKNRKIIIKFNKLKMCHFLFHVLPVSTSCRRNRW